MSESAPTIVTQTIPAPAAEPKEKKAPSQAKLESLANARAAKSKYRSEKSVVRNDNSADELLDRVARSDTESAVTKRYTPSSGSGKRKGYEGRGEGLGNGTIKYVLGAAAVAGLAYLGSSGFKSVAVPFSNTSQTQSGPQPNNGTRQPPVSAPPAGASLFTGAYSG